MTAGAAPRPTWLAAWWAVVRNDLRVLFLAPSGWVFLAAFLFLAGLMFVDAIGSTGEASLRPSIPNLAVTLLFTLPMVTLRQLAEEARSGTLELLLTLPVRLEVIWFGKWCATLTLCAGLLVCTAPFPAVLWAFGDPDLGVLVAGYLGLMACAALFSAVGLFASALSRDPTVAGVLAVGLSLPSWLASAAKQWMPGELEPLLVRVSFVEHLRSAARGVLDTGDLAWFAAVTAGFLVLTHAALDARRWR